MRLNQNMTPSQFPINMVERSESLTDWQSLTMTDKKRLSAKRTKLKFGSAPMAVEEERAGGLIGVSAE